MTLISVARVDMTGVGGGLGSSRWYSSNVGGTGVSVSDANAWLARLHTFYTALSLYTPTAVTFEFNPEVTILDVATGTVSALVTASVVPANVTGGSGAVFTSGTGARLDFRTGYRRRGREIRGAIFLVPLTSAAFAVSGNITAGTQTAIDGYWSAYFTGTETDGNDPVVYGRPHAADLHYPAEGGVAPLITSGSVGATPAFLRRRRN